MGDGADALLDSLLKRAIEGPDCDVALPRRRRRMVRKDAPDVGDKQKDQIFDGPSLLNKENK